MVKRLDESIRDPITYEIDYKKNTVSLFTLARITFLIIGIALLFAALTIDRLNPKLGIIFRISGFMCLARSSIKICHNLFQKYIFSRCSNLITYSPLNSISRILP